jgi:hypothetical protein
MRTDITIDQAEKTVKENLMFWKEMWEERCRLFKEIGEGTYSKHILSIIPDLIEEVEHNEKRFSSNEYAKKFFLTILSKYHIGRKAGTMKQCALSYSQQFAKEIQNELGFVIEALQLNQNGSHSFQIGHLLPCLQRIDTILRTDKSCHDMAGLFLTLLCKQEQIEGDKLEIIELCDTLILLFWRKGTLPESIESLASDILSGFEKLSEGQIYCSYPGRPEKKSLSDEDYERMLTSYFSKVTIEERFEQISAIYSRESKEYEVIFKVDGFDNGTSGFSIGDVTVYDPRKESHLKIAAFEGMAPDFSGIEKVVGNQLCVSVKIRGVDSSSMKLHARRKAERTLGLISRRRTREIALKLSNAYAICDSKGMEIAASIGGSQSGVFHPSILTEWKREEYERFGSWINSESTSRSIKIWLASMDWYRKAIECEQSSERLLNAWFSIEHLFQGKSKVSLRIPGFLRNRPNEKQANALWYADDRIAQIQLIISLVETEHELREYASRVANNFLPSTKLFFKLEYGKEFVLSEKVLAKFAEKDGTTYTGGGFVAASDDVIAELKANNLYKPMHKVELMRQLFFQKEMAMNKLQSEIWRIKDDVYNIYRIRNMLVHRATTDSALTEYFATRALEYSFSLLTELKWNLLRTKEDSEISSIDKYFQAWVLEGNLGLEAVQSGEMTRFQKWVFS